MSISASYPNLRPTLLLDFANSGRLDPRVTFTRASTATYFDETGVLQSAAINAPRFDYDPATLAARGFLIEESRTNSFQYSEQFDDAYWTKAAASISSDSAVAPDGLTTADGLIEDTATSAHSMGRTVSFTSGTTYTASIFAKEIVGSAKRYLSMIFTSSAFGVNIPAVFDLGTGTITVVGVGSPTITPVGNGWYRCTITATATVTTSATMSVARLSNSSSSGLPSYTGDGTSGLYVWGAQIEAGAFPTSYIPTTTTALTRSADVASVNTLSPWYNSTEWTLYAEWQRDTTANAAAGGGTTVPRVVSLNRAATASDFQIRLFSATGVEAVASGASPQGYVASTWAASTVVKSALRYQVDNFALDTNLGSLAVDTSIAAQPASDQLALGQPRTAAGNGYLSGWLRRVTFYPRALSDAELDAITA